MSQTLPRETIVVCGHEFPHVDVRWYKRPDFMEIRRDVYVFTVRAFGGTLSTELKASDPRAESWIELNTSYGVDKKIWDQLSPEFVHLMHMAAQFSVLAELFPEIRKKAREEYKRARRLAEHAAQKHYLTTLFPWGPR